MNLTNIAITELFKTDLINILAKQNQHFNISRYDIDQDQGLARIAVAWPINDLHQSLILAFASVAHVIVP